MQPLADLLAGTVTRLEQLGAHDEALAALKLGRGIGNLRTPPMLIPVGRAWRLGVVLLDRLGNLYATGEVTRAIEPQIAVTNRSDEAERKRELRRMAARGPFAEGETINVDFSMLDVDDAALARGEGPLSLADSGEVLVRLPSGSDIHFEKYLADRVGLFNLD